jgi:DNA polymerase-3 subunit alpha
MANIKTGDSIRASIAGCVEGFQKRISKNGNKYAFLKLSDVTGDFEGMLFSDALVKYEEIINSGYPLLVKVRINKQSDEENPRIMVDSVQTIDQAIADQAKGVVITVSDVSAVSEIKKVLYMDKRGVNKVFLEPELEDWDVRIELDEGFAFSDNMMFSRLTSIPGVSSVKEF